MACDICGKTGETLEDLKSEYQTKDIKQICSKCLCEINDHIWKLRKMSNKMNESWGRRFMENLKYKFST